MKKNIFNRVLFMLTLTIITCFSRVNSVRAIFTFDIENYTNLYSHCNKDNQCYPVCVYGNDEAFIGYYYGSSDEFASNSGWEVAFGYNFDEGRHSGGMGAHAIGKSLLYWKDSYLLKTNVYPGELLDDWSNTEMYNNVINKFQCPQYLYIDLANQNELCFANEEGKCEKVADNDPSVTFKNPIKLTYNINDELTTVNRALHTARHFDNNSNYKADDKVKFLFSFDTQINYNDSKSAEENIEKNCKHFSDKINVDGGQSYIKKLIKGDYVKNYITDLNNGYSDIVARIPSGIRYPEIFNYDMQKQLLVFDNKKYRNEYFEKVDKLLEDNIIDSIKYASSICDSTEYKINLDEEKSRSIIDGEYTVYKFEDPEIDFDDEFRCSDIFTEEMVDVIKTSYFIIEMVGLAILIVFSALDYIKVFMGDNADELKKANSNFIRRLIILVILFLLPALVNVILRLFKIDYVEGIDSKYHLCVHVSNK